MTDRTDRVGDDATRDGDVRLPDHAESESQIEDLVSYEEDGALVVCDRSNPRAWIKSDDVEPLRE